MNSDRLEEDLLFILSPDKWPNWPLLPVKNIKERGKDGFPRFGVLVDGKGHTIYCKDHTIYLVGLFDDDLAEKLAAPDCPKVEYPTWAAFQDAGWIVD